MPITQKDIYPQFKWEVAARLEGAPLPRCFDCGSCTGICPVSQQHPEFNPRRIVHQIKLGLKEQLLRSPVIWYCTHCDTCAFSCPQEVRFSTIIEVLRDLALEQGFADPEAWAQWVAGPCKAACPANISIPGFISAIRQGRYAEGLRLIKRDLPFPGICGRVCPHPCETHCNRSQGDAAVAIMHLKRFLADAPLAREGPEVRAIREKRPEKVAIIGAGPAGLTAAYYLAQEGYRVTIFDRLPVPGGMMAVGIPAFRLPREIMQQEIEAIQGLGVDFRLNCEVGRDLSFSHLQDEFAAAFISVGLHKSQSLGIPGEDEWSGVMDGITFLREVNLGRPPALSGTVAVIGGGNVALDCARVALRLGYGPVTILYRRTREEMPAYPEEVASALEEGAQIQYLIAPVAITGQEGKATGLTCRRLRLGEADESGRRRPLPIPDSEFFFPAEVVITAIGQAAAPDFLTSVEGLAFSGKNLLVVDPVTGATNIPGVFAGGDIVSGPGTVVAAIQAGKEAAISIDRHLKGQDLRTRRSQAWRGLAFSPQGLEPQPREVMPRLPLAKRVRTFKEVELGFTEDQACREAARCARICGLQKKPEGPQT